MIPKALKRKKRILTLSSLQEDLKLFEDKEHPKIQSTTSVPQAQHQSKDVECPSLVSQAQGQPIDVKCSSLVSQAQRQPIDVECSSLVPQAQGQPIDVECMSLVHQPQGQSIDVECTSLVSQAQGQPIDVECSSLVPQAQGQPKDVECTSHVPQAQGQPMDVECLSFVPQAQGQPKDVECSSLVSQAQGQPIDVECSSLVSQAQGQPIDVECMSLVPQAQGQPKDMECTSLVPQAQGQSIDVECTSLVPQAQGQSIDVECTSLVPQAQGQSIDVECTSLVSQAQGQSIDVECTSLVPQAQGQPKDVECTSHVPQAQGQPIDVECLSFVPQAQGQPKDVECLSLVPQAQGQPIDMVCTSIVPQVQDQPFDVESFSSFLQSLVDDQHIDMESPSSCQTQVDTQPKEVKFSKVQPTQPLINIISLEEEQPYSTSDEDEFQDSGSESEYKPGSSIGSLSDHDQSVEEYEEHFLTKEVTIECSGSDDELSDTFPMLDGPTQVIGREQKLDKVTNDGIKEIDESDKDEDESDDDLNEDEILRDKNTKGLYIKKICKSSTTKTGKHKHNRVYNSYHYCDICHVKVSNFAQHLDRNKDKHLSSQEINEIRTEVDPKRKVYLRKLLRAKFNHKFNLKNIRKRRGEVLLERRPSRSFDVGEYGPCPKCYLWIAKKLVLKHQSTCIANKTDEHTTETSTMLLTRSDIIAERIQSEASKSLVKEVFMTMRNDEVGAVVRSDPLIIHLGNVWMEKNVDNRLKRGAYTADILRLVGRLLINLRNLKPPKEGVGNLWDYLKPEMFDTIAEATLVTASPASSNDDEHMNELMKPSNAIKLGYDIKRIINFKIGLSIMKNDDKSRKEAENLLKTMEIFWGTKVTKLARVLLERRKYSKRNELPLPEDIRKLTDYLKNSITDLDLTQADASTFHHVAEIVSARLLTYNRRRTGELQAISLEDYSCRKIAGSGDITEHVLGDCTEFEKKLLATQELMTVRGKTGRGVPILIPEDCSPGLSYLAKDQVRKSAGVPPTNPYIFANQDGVVRGYGALVRACRNADLVYPDRITSTNLRKYMATMTQVLDLKEHEMNWVLNHLGHTLDVHQIHYRCTSEALEKTQIAKILLLQDHDMIGKFRNKTLQEIQLADLVPQNDNSSTTDLVPDQQSKHFNQIDTPEEDIEEALSCSERMSLQEDQGIKKKRPRKKTKNLPRQGWQKEEEVEIECLFQTFFGKKIRPKPLQIKKLMDKSRKDGGMIHLRKMDVLKKKIFRMIDKLAK